MTATGTKLSEGELREIRFRHSEYVKSAAFSTSEEIVGKMLADRDALTSERDALQKRLDELRSQKDAEALARIGIKAAGTIPFDQLEARQKQQTVAGIKAVAAHVRAACEQDRAAKTALLDVADAAANRLAKLLGDERDVTYGERVAELGEMVGVVEGKLGELAAANERAAELERDAKSIKSIIFGGPMPKDFKLEGIVEEVRQGVIAHDRAKRKAEADADDEAAARRVAEKDRDRLAAELAALRKRHEGLVTACEEKTTDRGMASIHEGLKILSQENGSRIIATNPDGWQKWAAGNFSRLQAVLSPQPEQPVSSSVDATLKVSADWKPVGQGQYRCRSCNDVARLHPQTNDIWGCLKCGYSTASVLAHFAESSEQVLAEVNSPEAAEKETRIESVDADYDAMEQPAADFKCPKCGGTEFGTFETGGLYCKDRAHCGWRGDWSEVQAAQAKAAKPDEVIINAPQPFTYACPRCRHSGRMLVWTYGTDDVRCEQKGCGWRGKASEPVIVRVGEQPPAKPDAPGDAEKVEAKEQPAAVEGARDGERFFLSLRTRKGGSRFPVDHYDDRAFAERENEFRYSDCEVVEVVPKSALDALESKLAESETACGAMRTFLESEDRNDYCEFTKHPSGTDTWMVGRPCQCGPCQRWLKRHEFLESSDAGRTFAERMKRLEKLESRVRAMQQEGLRRDIRFAEIDRALEEFDQQQPEAEAK